MSQVYDIGLAAQCNEAVRQAKDLLRRRIRQKAQLEGVRPRYAVTEKEILQLAIVHHEEAVSQNKENRAVLRAARQGGWLSFRPDIEGKLVSCEDEKWCRTLIEGSDRIPKDPFFKNRGMWIEEGVVQDLTPEQAKEASLTAFRPETVQEHEQVAQGVVVDFAGSEANREDAGLSMVAGSVLELCQSEEDREFLKDLMESRERSEARKKRLAEIAAAPSQIPKVKHRLTSKTKCKRKGRVELKELRKEWKKKQGTKTAEQAASKIVLSVGKKRSNGGSLVKALKKKIMSEAPKKQKKDAEKEKPKLEQKDAEKEKPKLEQKGTKKAEKKKEEIKKAKAEQEQLRKDHPLFAKTVRIVGDGQARMD